MDFHKEIDEFSSSFRKGGILTRTFLILGFFFSISSLASLSSKIIEWKGFILDGINFYQFYIVDSITTAGSIFGLNYSRPEIHAAIILSICVTVGMRILSIGQNVAFRQINERYRSDLKPDSRIFWFIAIAFPFGIWSWYGISEQVIHPWVVAIVFLFYPVFIIAPKAIMSKFNYEHFEKNHFSYIKSYYAYIGTLLIIVGILAAINTGINEGMSRSLSENSLPQAKS